MASLIFVAHADSDPAGAALGVLTQARDKSVTVAADAEGSGSFVINRFDSQAAWCEPGNYIAAYRDTVAGDPIAGFWIDGGTDTVVSTREQGGQDMGRTGKGPLMCLDEAVVWDRKFRGGFARIRRRRGTWVWQRSAPFSLARPLMDLVREAKARNSILFVSLTFTSTHDSDGNPWPSDCMTRRWSTNIGTTLTEVVTTLRAAGLRIEMDASFRISAWPDDRVNDLSGSIEIVTGVDIAGDVQRQRNAPRTKSHVLVGGERRRGGERFVAVGNATYRAELGRRKEGFRDLGRTASRPVLRRTGRRSLRRWHVLRDGSVGVPILDKTGQVALVDYQPGDTVTLTIPGAYSGGQAIAAITLADIPNGEYDPVLEFNAPLPDPVTGEDWSDDAATAVRAA